MHHCIHRALQSRSPYHCATRAGSQGEDEQSYTHDQPQALGHSCPPCVMAPLRLEWGWNETLSCRVCCGGDGKELHLTWVCIVLSACVLLLQAGGASD